jgi:hypothetical protein
MQRRCCCCCTFDMPRCTSPLWWLRSPLWWWVLVVYASGSRTFASRAHSTCAQNCPLVCVCLRVFLYVAFQPRSRLCGVAHEPSCFCVVQPRSHLSDAQLQQCWRCWRCCGWVFWRCCGRVCGWCCGRIIFSTVCVFELYHRSPLRSLRFPSSV